MCCLLDWGHVLLCSVKGDLKLIYIYIYIYIYILRLVNISVHLLQAARLAGKSAVVWLGELLWKIIRWGGSALVGAGQVDYFLCLL